MPTKKLRIAINGYGRIGRNVHRQVLNTPDIEIVATNSRSDVESRAHLLQYDSLYGTLPNQIEVAEDHFMVDGSRVESLIGEPGVDFQWSDYAVDIVIEATGRLTTYSDAEKHLQAGSKKVLVTAPCKDIRVPTFVMGVNDREYNSNDKIVSNASCTTNCLAPVLKVLHDSFGIEAGQMTTVHSVTSDQRIHDNDHKDLRRARAFLPSIIPTKTGVSSALARVLPEVARKIKGIALRVPTLTVSCVDLAAELHREVTVEEVNAAFRKAAAGELKGILAVNEKPLVSIDFKGDSHSSIFDATVTKVAANGRLVKALSWYDNEWGYSARVVDLIHLIAK